MTSGIRRKITMTTQVTGTPTTAIKCWWCIDGEPGWEAAEIYLNYEPRFNYLWEALQELWFDYSQSICPRTKMRHVPQGTPYPGLIDP